MGRIATGEKADGALRAKGVCQTQAEARTREAQKTPLTDDHVLPISTLPSTSTPTRRHTSPADQQKSGWRVLNDELHYEERWEPPRPATTARTWIDAFAWCVISGLTGERDRVIGAVLRKDCAPAIRDGVPYSTRESVSTPADLAEMDALCGYLTVVHGPRPGALPGPAPLGKPDAAARARTAGRLDAAGALTPDQQLLRVLLDDDQGTFEQALGERLVAYRENARPDPVPRSLLPVGALTLAALATQTHGWELGIRSPYLPESLIRQH
ncbi:immunity 49 family protein [Streptomyces sp. NBC_01314]|uniref:immunity 49 family protein n=1 Tax=Streptomyces sp. NBC_01314 TaxID=2903821 RepID=UPI003085A948|nr:immunity 49 family protein [Streptomyces sp. NBC_01314]